MQRYLIMVLLGASLIVTGHAARAQTSTCPADVNADVMQACPCDSFKNHGQFMKCVRNRLDALRKSGCDANSTAQAGRCAAASICGKRHSPIICCNRHGHAKLASADKCTTKGGTVMTGMKSICEPTCPPPQVP